MKSGPLFNPTLKQTNLQAGCKSAPGSQPSIQERWQVADLKLLNNSYIFSLSRISTKDFPYTREKNWLCTAAHFARNEMKYQKSRKSGLFQYNLYARTIWGVGGYSHTLPIRVCTSHFLKKQGYFNTNFLEWNIKNWPISRTGVSILGGFFLEWGANLESRAAHTHPKNTQVQVKSLSVNTT